MNDIVWNIALILYLYWACVIAYGFKAGWNELTRVRGDGSEEESAIMEALCIIFWPYFLVITIARGTFKIGKGDRE
jgi:hypothetical protein